MADQSIGLTIEPEPENDTLVIRVHHYVVDTPESLDALQPIVFAGFQAMPTLPCYILFDITGLTIAPRMRTYLDASSQDTAPLIRALFVFSQRPNPVTELLLHIGTDYNHVPYSYSPDEATARAALLRFRAADTHPLPPLTLPQTFDTSGQ
jgi:hypothetical protein